MDPTPVSAEQVPDFVRAVFDAFHYAAPPDEVEERGKNIEPERTLVLRDGGRIVAATGIFTRELTVPGAIVPVAAVTMVGVQPTHRRRGMLTALMRRQLADVHEGGREAIAALWASEAAIYGRFGYGMASLVAELDVAKQDAVLRTAPTSRSRSDDPVEAVDAMRPVHEAVRPAVPGMLDRHGRWWATRVRDPEHDREGAEPLRAAVVEGIAYALFAIKRGFEHGRPSGEVRVREVLATSPVGPRRDLGLPARARPHPPDRVGRSAGRRAAPAHDQRVAGGPDRGRRRAVAAHRRPAASAGRPHLRRAVRRGHGGLGRRLPVERRPLGAPVGRHDGDLRAHLAARGARAVDRRAWRGVSRRSPRSSCSPAPAG